MFKKFLVSISIILSLTAAHGAYALGLGDIKVKSYLDSPLNVHIRLLPSPSDDLSTLNVKVASDAQFRQAGISKQSFHRALNFKVVNNTSAPYLQVTSAAALGEPFLHLLLDFNWNSGRILREYTALIDPPVYANKNSNQVAQPLAPATSQVYTTPSYQAANTYSGASVNSSIASLPTAQTFPIDSYDTNLSNAQTTFATTPADSFVSYPSINEVVTSVDSTQIGPVIAGDSLSSIAESIQNRYPDLSIYQIMYVLFRDNPSAFIDQNINRLVKGSVLQVPTIDDISGVKKTQGQTLFYSHLAKLSADSLASDVPVGSVSGSISQALDTVKETTASIDESQEFKVGGSQIATASATQGNDDAEKQIATLKQQLSNAEATLETAKLENAELEERLSILERQLADANELIKLESESARELVEQLKNNEIAQQSAEALQETVDIETSKIEVTEPETVESEAEVVIEPDVVDSAPIDEIVKSTPNAIDEAVNTADEAVNKADEAVNKADEIVNKTTDEIATKTDEVINKAEELSETLSFVDKAKAFVGDNVLPLGGGLAVLMASLLGMSMLRRNKRSNDEFEDTITDLADMDIDSRPDLSSDSETASADFRTAETTITKESSFLTVYSDSEVVVHADEIDPIAEADVYIAYGRDEQGEEVLLEGVRKFPNRPDIKLSLLKLYLKRKDVSKFDGVAEQLFAGGHNDNPDIWDKVVEMGSVLSPDNPMYQVDYEDKGRFESNSITSNTAAPAVAATAAATAAIAAAATEAKTILSDDKPLDDIELLNADDVMTTDLDIQSTQSETEFVDISSGDTMDIDLDDYDLDKSVDDSKLNIDAPNAAQQQSVDVDSDTTIALDELDLELENASSLTEATIVDDSDLKEVSAKQSKADKMSEIALNDIEVISQGESADTDDAVEFDDYDQNSILDVDLLDANASADSINVDSIIDDLSSDVDPKIEESVAALTPEPIVKGPGVDFEEPLSIQLEDVTLDVTPQAEIADPATQLELAKVFIELDDTSGAKEILESLTDVSDKAIKTEVADLIKNLKK